MSISEAAITLGTSTHAIRTQARAGKLESRDDNGTLYVRLIGRHADAIAFSRSPVSEDATLSEERAAQRSRVWRKLLTTASVILLGGTAGMLGYCFFEARHKEAVDQMLAANRKANQQLAEQLEAQRLQSISLTRQLHEERMNVKRSAENVERLSSQVETASMRLQHLEEQLSEESSQREALVAQRMEIVEERDQLTQELAEMMKHLAVARKQLNESQHELSEARSRLANLPSHPQASPLPREMLEDFAPKEPSRTSPQGGDQRIESSTAPTSAREPFSALQDERWKLPTGEGLTDRPRLVTVVPSTSDKRASD